MLKRQQVVTLKSLLFKATVTSHDTLRLPKGVQSLLWQKKGSLGIRGQILNEACKNGIACKNCFKVVALPYSLQPSVQDKLTVSDCAGQVCDIERIPKEPKEIAHTKASLGHLKAKEVVIENAQRIPNQKEPVHN